MKNQKTNILIKFACTLLPLLISGCLTIPDMEYELPPSEVPLTGTSTSSASTMGSWAGTVVYYLPNGQTSAISMNARVGPGRDSVTCMSTGSDVETCVAHWSGNTVSWSSPGGYPSVTVFSLTAVGARSAKMTSTCTLRNGLTVRGTGTFTRQ